MNKQLYLNIQKIIHEMNKLIENDYIKNLHEKYEIKNAEDETYIWNLISTTLLLNEKLCKNTKIDKFLSDKFALSDIQGIILDYIEEFPNYLLDENNNIVERLDKYIKHEEPVYFDEPFYDYNFNGLENKKNNLKTINYNGELLTFYINGNNPKGTGCNDLIIKEYLDIKEFTNQIRNSLAHSSYEILDDNYIRLYNYKNDTKELNLNIKINKITILTIIDVINNKTYKDYKILKEDYFMSKWPDIYDYATREELKNFINDYSIISEKDIEKIIDDVKNKSWDYSVYYNDYQKASFLMYKKVRNDYTIALALDNFIYNDKKNDKLYDDYFYRKYGTYKYYQDPLDDNNNETKEFKFKLLLQSLLNIIITTSYNNEQSDIYNNLNFSKMKFNTNVIEIIEEKINNEINEIKKEIFAIKKEYQIEAKSLKNCIANNEKYFNKHNCNNIKIQESVNNILKTIKILDEKLKLNKIQYKNCILNLNDLKENKIASKPVTSYIFNHLRNSLAHGNITLPEEMDFNDLNNNEIIFEDYNKSKLTFKGTINLQDLLDIITNKKYVIETFKTKRLK